MKKLIVPTENKLETFVLKSINADIKDSGYDSVETRIKEIIQNGCVSGAVSELISYNQTTKFFEKYKIEINALLVDLIESTGEPVGILFGDKWDNSDPLALETQNQNLLAWFGYEETTRILAERAGIEI